MSENAMLFDSVLKTLRSATAEQLKPVLKTLRSLIA